MIFIDSVVVDIKQTTLCDHQPQLFAQNSPTLLTNDTNDPNDHKLKGIQYFLARDYLQKSSNIEKSQAQKFERSHALNSQKCLD